MKKTRNFIFILLILASLSIAGWRHWQQPLEKNSYNQSGQEFLDLLSIPDQSLVTAKLGQHQLEIEVVNSYPAYLSGLSHRQEIGSDGMLFVFPQQKRHGIWMKDMSFDLDLIWIDQNRVAEITLGAKKPQPGQTEADLPVYQPTQPVDMILEVEAGFVQARQVEVGDQLKIKELAESS